jgi:hypothetical protein
MDTGSLHQEDLLSRRSAPWLGALCVLAALGGIGGAQRVFFASWLAAAWFVLGLAAGALSWLWIHRLTGGRWGTVLRPQLLRLSERLPRVLLLFLPLLLGGSLLYPPFHAARGTPANVAAALAAWHAPTFALARCVGYGVAWLVLARRARALATSGEAAASLMLQLVVTTLASIDLLVALVPHWSSSIFGLMVLVGQSLGALTAAIALSCRTIAAHGPPPATDGAPLTRDFGNLLLAAVLTWAYLSFMQLLIIWAEDLPREISWYLPRLQTGWIDVAVALVVLHFALPMTALLFRAVKDRPGRLALLALALLGAHALDVAWLVLPSVAPHALSAWWITPLLMVGLTLIAFGGGGTPRAPNRPALAVEALPDGRA